MELFYSTGGHGGPYDNAVSAVTRAIALLKGNRNERHIDVRPDSTSSERETLYRIAKVKEVIETENIIVSQFNDKGIVTHAFQAD